MVIIHRNEMHKSVQSTKTAVMGLKNIELINELAYNLGD